MANERAPGESAIIALETWRPGSQQLMTRLAVVLLLVVGSFAADKQILVTKTVEDDNAVPGGRVFRLLAEDDSATYELACSLKKGVSTPAVDKRLFKGLAKNLVPTDTACGPFTAGERYSVMFHEADPKRSHIAGRLVTFMVEDPTTKRVSRMVVFKVERVESK